MAGRLGEVSVDNMIFNMTGHFAIGLPCTFMALLVLGAVSDLSPLNCSKADVVFAGSCSPGVSKKLGDLKRAFGRPNPSGRANHPRSGASLSVPFLEPFPRSIKLTRPR